MKQQKGFVTVSNPELLRRHTVLQEITGFPENFLGREGLIMQTEYAINIFSHELFKKLLYNCLINHSILVFIIHIKAR